MSGSKPKAKPPYRVPRSQIDDRYPRSSPLSDTRIGSGEVLAVDDDGETMTVSLGDEGDTVTALSGSVGGVVPLGCPPEVGDWVEVHQRGDLLVSPESATDWWTQGGFGLGGGGGPGGGTGNIMAAYRVGTGAWQTRPSTLVPPYVTVQWIGVDPPPDIIDGLAVVGDLYLQTDF